MSPHQAQPGSSPSGRQVLSPEHQVAMLGLNQGPLANLFVAGMQQPATVQPKSNMTPVNLEALFGTQGSPNAVKSPNPSSNPNQSSVRISNQVSSTNIPRTPENQGRGSNASTKPPRSSPMTGMTQVNLNTFFPQSPSASSPNPTPSPGANPQMISVPLQNLFAYHGGQRKSMEGSSTPKDKVVNSSAASGPDSSLHSIMSMLQKSDPGQQQQQSQHQSSGPSSLIARMQDSDSEHLSQAAAPPAPSLSHPSTNPVSFPSSSSLSFNFINENLDNPEKILFERKQQQQRKSHQGGKKDSGLSNNQSQHSIRPQSPFSSSIQTVPLVSSQSSPIPLPSVQPFRFMPAYVGVPPGSSPTSFASSPPTVGSPTNYPPHPQVQMNRIPPGHLASSPPTFSIPQTQYASPLMFYGSPTQFGSPPTHYGSPPTHYGSPSATLSAGSPLGLREGSPMQPPQMPPGTDSSRNSKCLLLFVFLNHKAHKNRLEIGLST